MNKCLMMLLHPNADLMPSIGDRCVVDFDKLADQVCLTVGNEDDIIFARSESPWSAEGDNEGPDISPTPSLSRQKSRRLDDFDKIDSPTSRSGSMKRPISFPHVSEHDQKVDEEAPEEPR